MRRRIYAISLAAAAALHLAAPSAQAAPIPLSTLVGGTSLTQGDATFDGFAFEDFPGISSLFPGDRNVSADQIEITTSATANSVTLTAKVTPPISIAGDNSGSLGPGDNHVFQFFLDFTVSLSPFSTRQITNVILDGGDLFATGEAFSEVVYDIDGFSRSAGDDLAIFEAQGPSSQKSHNFLLTGSSTLDLFGRIEGNTNAGATAGLSTFSLTFELSGSEPPNVVPLPASVVLLLAGLGGLGLVARRRNA